MWQLAPRALQGRPPLRRVLWGDGGRLNELERLMAVKQHGPAHAHVHSSMAQKGASCVCMGGRTCARSARARACDASHQGKARQQHGTPAGLDAAGAAGLCIAAAVPEGVLRSHQGGPAKEET